MRKRLDVILFENKLISSREKAQCLIMAGQVLVDGKKETKPGSKFEESVKIEVLESPKYVGRGAEKLEGAAKVFKIDFQNKVVCDIGSSTGGFTDFALQNGAKRVYAIDVGKGQLDWWLRNDKRVVVMEGINFRYLKELPEKIDIFLVDVAFISVRKILPVIKGIMNNESRITNRKQTHNSKFIIHDSNIILLFKPQFEAGKKIADQYKGVIKDSKIHKELLENFRKWCSDNGFEILGNTESPIKGDKGNKEFFFILNVKS